MWKLSAGSAMINYRLYSSVNYQFINSSATSHTNLEFGVPQGSVLGPILYVFYQHPWRHTTKAQRSISSVCRYTDDTQLYLFFKSYSLEYRNQSVEVIQSHNKDIDEWMTICINKLKLNKTTETEFIGSRHGPKTQLKFYR